MVFIKDLKVGEVAEGIFSLRVKHEVRKYSKGYMMSFTISDSTGEIGVKYWGGDRREDVDLVFNSLKKNDVVKIKGTVSEYKN